MAHSLAILLYSIFKLKKNRILVMKTIKWIVILTVALATISGCKKRNEQSQLTLKMTDAPAEYEEVNVHVIGFEVNFENASGVEEWVSVPVNEGVYNLLELQNNVTVILAEDVNILPGKINQMRLILGPNNSLLTTTGMHDLKVPSGEQTGIKINVNTVIKPDKIVILTIDFDAGKSVVEHGNGTYSLKPFITLKSLDQYER